MRLTLREAGTVVHADGDLAESLLAAGWVVADESAEEPEKKPAPRRKSSK